MVQPSRGIFKSGRAKPPETASAPPCFERKTARQAVGSGAGPRRKRTRFLSVKTPLLFDFKRRGEAGRFRGIFPPCPLPFDRTGGQHGAMGNRFNYRCPKCDSPDEIEIEAIVSVRLTSTGTEGDASNCTPEDWTDFNGAGCNACGYDGAPSPISTGTPQTPPEFAKTWG
jgi:hypothetical protein